MPIFFHLFFTVSGLLFPIISFLRNVILFHYFNPIISLFLWWISCIIHIISYYFNYFDFLLYSLFYYKTYCNNYYYDYFYYFNYLLFLSFNCFFWHVLYSLFYTLAGSASPHRKSSVSDIKFKLNARYWKLQIFKHQFHEIYHKYVNKHWCIPIFRCDLSTGINMKAWMIIIFKIWQPLY